MNTEIGTELHGYVQNLREALDHAGDRIPADVADEAREDLESVVRRLELGVHHTVVALVGGTGSGKSSTFNALTRLNFADVGVIRPTTSRASACTWYTDADPLLDFLGVDPQRRIARESALTGNEETALSGLVMLDLPDHDSINPENAALVDRLLPMIDLLIWVLDPQKYADNVLHEKYLQELTDRHEAMLVVVNQIDTVPDTGMDEIRTDVERLLAQDELTDVPVILASARTGHGIGIIKDHIGRMISEESIAARTARDELRAISRRIREALAPQTPSLPQTAHVTAEIANVAGAPAVGESINVAVAGAGGAALTKIQPPATSRIEAIRETWLDQVGGEMPAPWRASLAETVAARETFYADVVDALDAVSLPSPVDSRARGVRLLGAGLVLLGIVLAVIGLVLGNDLNLLVSGGGVAGLGAAAVLVARALRRRTARERSQSYLADVLLNLAAVVRSDLEDPARLELADHEGMLRATDL